MLGEPQTVKVFGIMHLVFAGFGLLSLAWALVMAVIGNPFLAFATKSPEIIAQVEQQAAMQAKMLPLTIIGSAITLIVAILMIIAGIRLLKKRKSGLTWSNRYAWTSLGTKVINMILAFVFTVPIMKETMGSTLEGAGSLSGMAEGIMIGSMVVGALISAIYPTLTLILLNRPKTKAWFATQPD